MKTKIFICLLIFLTLSTSSFAIFDFGLGNQIPQATYRVPMGSELEYMSKVIQELNYLYQMIENMEKTLNNDMNSSALMNILMGSESMMEIVNKEDLYNMSSDELENYIKNDISKIFGSFQDFTHEIERSVDNIENEWIKNEVKKDLLKNSTTIQKALLSADYELEEKEQNITKTFEESQNEIVNDYLEKIDYYSGISQAYGENIDDDGKPVKNSANHYIQKQKENILNSSTSLENHNSNMTLQTSINANTQMIMEMHRTQLEMLKAISDLNDQLRIIGEIYIKEHTEEKIKENRREHNKS